MTTNKIFGFLILIFTLTAFSHKFYVSITQIDYNPNKKQLQIATRYFIDDIEKAIANKYQEKIYIDAKTMKEHQKKLLEQYLLSGYLIQINNKKQPLNYLDFEIENDVLIVYFTINQVKKIKKLDIKINTLYEIISTQQHIIHTHIGDKKCSLLLTEDNKYQTCKY